MPFSLVKIGLRLGIVIKREENRKRGERERELGNVAEWKNKGIIIFFFNVIDLSVIMFEMRGKLKIMIKKKLPPLSVQIKFGF